MPVSVKNTNELEKLTGQELLYLQDDQLKKKLTKILKEKLKELKQKGEGKANNNKQALSHKQKRERRRNLKSSDVVGELAFSFIEPKNCVGNNIDISPSSQSEGRTRERNNTCRFSIIERLKHWGIECTKRRKENKYDMHYIHHGWEFRSTKEVLNYVLHEKYQGGMNRKGNKGIIAENSVILQETDPLETIKNNYVKGDDGSNEDKMIPKGIVEENLFILHEIDPLEVILQLERNDGSNEDKMIPKEIVAENSVILDEIDPLEAKNMYEEGHDQFDEDNMMTLGEIDSKNLVILHETYPLMEAIVNMCDKGYYPSKEDEMMIPIGPTTENLVILHKTNTLEAIMNMYKEGYDIRTNEDEMMIPEGTVAENLVIPYETDPLEVIKNMHEEGYEGSNEDQMMIPNWTALDVQLDAAVDFPFMYEFEPLRSKLR